MACFGCHGDPNLEAVTMTSTNMSSRQLLWGWAYILLGCLALLFLAWVLEQRRLSEAPDPASTDETEATLSREGIGNEEGDVPAKPPAEFGEPSNGAAAEDEVTALSVRDTGENQAEANAVTADPTHSEETESDKVTSPAIPGNRCALLPDLETQFEPHLEKLVWVRPAADGVSLAAVTDGTVVKRFNSPFTGNSIYVFSGRFCFLYGGFAAFEPGLEEGAAVRCGQLLGRAPKGTEHRANLYFSVLELNSGQDWWRGKKVDPRPFVRPESWVDPR